MRRWTIPTAVALALAIVLMLASAAGAGSSEPPGFVTHAVGTFDYVLVTDPDYPDGQDPVDGVLWVAESGYVLVPGTIEVEVDIESVGEPYGPYDDGSDYDVKWDYETRGSLRAKIDVVDPDGNRVKRVIRAHVEKVTLPWPALTEFYFFEGTFRGEEYNGYIGSAAGTSTMYLPILGQVLGGGDNYGIIHSSAGDFSYELNDTLTPPY